MRIHKFLPLLFLGTLAKANDESSGIVYLGGQAGAASFAGKIQSYEYINGVFMPDTNRKIDTGNGGFSGGFHIGMGYVFQNTFFTGIEGRFNGFSAKAKNESFRLRLDDDTNMTKDFTFHAKSLGDVSFILGGYIQPKVLLYLRAGVSFSKMQGSLYGTLYEDLEKHTITKTKPGFIGGLGFKWMPFSSMKWLYVGADWTANSSGKILHTFKSPEDGLPVLSAQYKQKFVHLALVTIGFKMKFFEACK